MRTFLVLICSLALACAASGGQEENKSKKPPPKKKRTQSSQHAVTAGGEPHEKVDPRQLMRQAQDDPSAKTKQKMKGSQSQQAAGGHYIGKPTTMVGTFIPKMGKPTTVSKTTGKPAANAGGTNYPGRNFDSLAFRTSIPAATQPGKATGKAAGAGKPTTVGKGVPINQIKQYGGDQASQGQGKPASGKKKGQKVSPTPIPQ
jgi:hypothetical protein